MRPPPRISAAVCTHNRAALLEGCLESLAAQTLESSDFEVLVVDNASTDATVEVVRRAQRRHGGLAIRLLGEERLGLSHARNAAYRAAAGPLVAYLDDDNRAGPDWLRLALELFATTDPTPDAVGGPVHPIFAVEPPAWYDAGLAELGHGAHARFLEPGAELLGGNMILPRTLLERLGGFDPALGLRGSRMVLGEDVELIRRVRQLRPDESRIYYEPRLEMQQVMEAHQLRVGYVLRRAFMNGYLKGVLAVRGGLGGRLRAATRAVAYLGWHSLKSLATVGRYGSPQAWLAQRVRWVPYHAGVLWAACRLGSTVEHRS